MLLEAVLFYKGEPMKKAALTKLLDASENELAEAISRLRLGLNGRGLTLVEDGDTVALATAHLAKEAIEKLRRDDMEGPLGKAGLETLAIIMYRQPVSRADIEYGRGVNSSSVLRSLTMRGLIEKKENQKDKRGYVYQTTPELPAALGLSQLSDMPEYDAMRARVEKVSASREDAADGALESRFYDS